MEPSSVVYEIARRYVADSAGILGPCLTNKALGSIRSRSVSSLVDISSEFDPVQHGHNVLRCLLQIEALFKKCDIFSNENCAEVAMQAFLESEEVCRATNDRLDGFYDLPESEWMRMKVERMVSIIDTTLGSFDSFLEVLPSLIRATNGATATHPRRFSGGALRLRRSMYATERSHKYLRALSAFWGYRINFRKIRHNRVELVPKNWKTHRTIACEPEGNSALQLAFDTYCKRKLKRRLNVDLSDQSRNQRLALESSVHGKLCTVDLKAASDRLALNVVHLLFPKQWADYFIDTRSPCWKDEHGVLRPYAKLSSMGNGYTFTIETLVFAAACKALGSKEFSVYGDDIIIETELLSDLMSLLAYLGFEINKEKTHAEIPEGTRTVACTDIHEHLTRLRESALSESNLRERLVNQSVDEVDHRSSSDRFDLPKVLLAWQRFARDHAPRSHGPCSGTGVYRESCGVHAFGGIDITPRYLRSLSTRRDWVLAVNNILGFGAPGGSLWQFAVEIVRQLNLPLGPPVLDTCACVFIDVHSCYRLGLIRTVKRFGPYQPGFRGLVERTQTNRIYDSRALFLWFLGRRERPFESSGHTLGTYKCRLKWMRYRPAMADIMGGSVHLHWWTELMLAREG